MQVLINGLSVYYEQLGEGRDIVLLHGWGCDSSLLKPLAASLAKFARVTLIDLPGHGKTSEPLNPFDVHDFAHTVYMLLEQLEIKKASFVGHSNGGRTIIALAQAHPEVIYKIVLCAASGIKPKRKLKYYMKVYGYKLGKNILKLPIFSEEIRQKYSQGKGSEDYKKLSPVMKATFVRLVNEDLTPVLKNIKASTLLIWGEQDTETPLYMAKVMEKEIPDCGLVLYPNAGHYAFLERFGQTERVLESFLA
jgi:pimeloyl-ACP methyl ester carboxylesterase